MQADCSSSEIDTLLKSAALVFVLVGPFVAYFQLRLNRHVNRARLALDLNKLFSENAEERKFFYTLDYSSGPNAFKFDPDKFMYSSQEQNLDSLLYKLSQVGYLLKHKTVLAVDIIWINSIARTVLENRQVHAYLAWLSKDMPGHRSFADLTHLCNAVCSGAGHASASKALATYSSGTFPRAGSGARAVRSEQNSPTGRT